MTLNGPVSSFMLEIVGYQFAQQRGNFDDDNWLSIRIHVEHPRGSWSSVDPSLQTTEVEELASWLASIADGQPVESYLWFTEPNLSFRLVTDDRGTDAVRVYFELESRPTWAPSRSVPGEDLWVEVPLAPAEMNTAARALRAEASRFPVRGKR